MSLKNKLINVLFILILLVFIVNVKALSSFPDDFTINSEGQALTLNNNHSLQIDTSHNVDSTHYYPYFHVKNSSSGNVICVSGLGVSEPAAASSYTKYSWDDANKSKGVAYIINTIIGEGGNSSISYENYYWSEVLINAYLGTYTPSSGSYMYDNVISKSVTIASTGKTYNEILEGAKSYASADYNSSLSADKTSLTFTASSDGYYYSEPVTINSTTAYSISSLSNSKFTYDKNGDTYTFKIKSLDISLGGSESFSVTVTNSGKEYYTAERYSCNNCSSTYQDLTLSQTVKNTSANNTLTITGSVSKSAVQIQIVKVDENNNYLPDTQFMFQTEEQRNNNTDGVILISKEQGSMVVENLTQGIYYLTEIVAPNGYNKINEPIVIVIDADGKITVDGEENATGIIEITNELTKTEISKISAVDNKELPGATLKILNEKNEKISCVIIKDGKQEALDDCSWTSGDTPVKIIGLPVGKYYLVETIAPKGYALNEEKVLFEVKGDGTVTKVEMENQLEVEVPSTLSSRSALLLAIAMFDIALGIGIVTYVQKNKIKEQ